VKEERVKFNGQIKGIAVKPVKDGSFTEVRILASTKRQLPEQLARLLLTPVSVEITEQQMELPGTESEGDE
jgi:hypothetical protein